MPPLKIITYNVNGLRANMAKTADGAKIEKGDDGWRQCGLEQLIKEHDPDIIAFQETRCPKDCIDHPLFQPFAYKRHEGSKQKQGYSGVAVLSKFPPIKDMTEDFPNELNQEGRFIALEFSKFYFINTYTPNTKPDLSRLDFRTTTWEPAIREFINKLNSNKKKKPIIFVSDFNVAPTPLDIYTTKGKDKSNGYTPQERSAFTTLLEECQLLNSFRFLKPEERKYSWFSPILNKRRDISKGWLIDMVLISKSLNTKLVECDILSEYWGSDHKPVYATLKI